ncbi:hypothetical protein D0T49_02615 [Paludibacter sp. 221]|uniref:hypothetical protein n=1 Tax=Paludibacter sp. 221 TaxID=2302939 RepID=UPI0013D05B1A|nr:hypothetical protein [Paludibacter sp. 221]NDV45939.1 hypothetical protein [Paludibacter sp. 221]
MMKNYLFPVNFKKAGRILFIPFLVLAVFQNKITLEIPVFALLSDKLFGGAESLNVLRNNIIDEIAYIGLIVSLIFIAFSKEKDEDEYINQIRANSLVWALLVNYTILILEIIFIYGIPFLYVLNINLFSILILYIIKFNIALYSFRKSGAHEE